MKKNYILLSLILLCSLQMYAQLQPVWNEQVGSEIMWNSFSPDGKLICGTNDGKTVAVDSKNGKIIWSSDLKKGPFKTLPNTPYIYWSDGDLLIFDPLDGKRVCDSKKYGVDNIQDFYPVRTGNGLLIYSKMNDLEQVTMVDLNDGSLRWKREFDFSKKKQIGGITFAMAEDSSKMELHCSPIGDGNGGVFISFHEHIMYLNKDGKTVWDIDYPSQTGNQAGFFKASGVKFKNIIPDNTGERLYVFSGGYMTCIDRKTGEHAWGNPVNLYAPVKNIIFENDEMVLIPTPNTAVQKAYINCVDYTTGTPKFGDKELRLKGGFVQSAFCSKGIVIIAKAFMNNTYFFNIINQETGKFELDKPIKIFEGPYDIVEVNGGILISSPNGANVYNFDTKELTIDNELKVGKDGKLCRYERAGKSYLYSSTKKNIFIFDHETLKVEQFNKAKFDLKGGDTAEGFTGYKDGLVLHSAQNIVKLDWNGNVIFEKYYKAPTAGAWQIVKASMGAIGGLAQIAAAAATSAAVSELENQTNKGLDITDEEAKRQLITGEMSYADYSKYSKDSKEMREVMAEAREETNKEMAECAVMGLANTLEASASIARVASRFKNSKATKNYVVLMTNIKEEGGVGLAVVSKKDGEVKLFIPMKQSRTEPGYNIDPVTNLLFWMPSVDASLKSKRFPDIAEMQKKGVIIAFDMNKL